MPPLLLALALVAADAGPAFRDSTLGFDLGGKGVIPLDERWVTGLGSEPLFMRVERQGDSGSVAFYAATRLAQADAGPVFEGRARFSTVIAPELDAVRPIDLGSQGPAFVIQLHEGVPDDGRAEVMVVGRGPRRLLETSHAGTESTPVVLRLEAGRPVLTVISAPKVLRFAGPRGEQSVEVGHHETEYGFRDGAFAEQATRYRDAMPPLPLRALSAPELVDGKLETGAVLHPGQPVRLELVTPASVSMLRLVPSCVKAKRGAAKKVQLMLGEGEPIDIEIGQPVASAQVAGAGLFDLGPGGGEQELLVFDPPINVDHLSLAVTQGDGPKGSACVAEVTLHGSK